MFRTHVIYFCDKDKNVNDSMLANLDICLEKMEVAVHIIRHDKKRIVAKLFCDKLYLVGGMCDIICIGAHSAAITMLDILNKYDVDYKSILTINPNNFFTRYFFKPIRVRNGISSSTVNIFQKINKPYGVFVEGATNVRITVNDMDEMNNVILNYIEKALAGA